jgi:hypothetical protein
MSKEAADRHEQLENLLIQGRMTGSWTEDADDVISEEMADLWYEMSDEERSAAKERVAPYAQALAKARSRNVSTTNSASTFQELLVSIDSEEETPLRIFPIDKAVIFPLLNRVQFVTFSQLSRKISRPNASTGVTTRMANL